MEIVIVVLKILFILFLFSIKLTRTETITRTYSDGSKSSNVKRDPFVFALALIANKAMPIYLILYWFVFNLTIKSI